MYTDYPLVLERCEWISYILLPGPLQGMPMSKWRKGAETLQLVENSTGEIFVPFIRLLIETLFATYNDALRKCKTRDRLFVAAHMQPIYILAKF